MDMPEAGQHDTHSGPPDSTQDALQRWAGRLSHKIFPIFDHTAGSIEAIDESSGASIDRFCSTILYDPGVMLAMLRKVNASPRQRLAADVTSIENAAMMIGLDNVKNIPSRLPQIKLPARTPAERGYVQVVSRAYHAGYQAYDWAVRRADMVPKEVFVAAFLHDIGEMALWLDGGEEMLRIQELVHEEHMPADEAQYVVLGFSVEQLSLELARRWRLPEFIQQTLHAESADHSRVLGVMLASQLARQAELNWYSPASLACIENVADFLEVSYATASHLVHQNAVKAARETEHYGAWPAAANLPLIHVPEFEEQGADGTFVSDGLDVKPVHFCLVPQRDIYDQICRRLREFDGIHDVNSLIEVAMRGFHDGLGLNRVVFAILSLDHSQLHARHLAGTDNDPVFSQFAIALEPANLFTHIIKKQQSVWINDDNRKRFWPMVPVALQRLIRTDSFMASSIFARGKSVGMFYADRHLTECHLDIECYNRFKHLSRLVAAGIERLSGQ